MQISYIKNNLIEFFKRKLDEVQYNASLVITGGIKGTFQECLYHKLGLQSLNDCRLSHKLLFFHKITNGFSPLHLQEISSSRYMQHYQSRSKSAKNIEKFKTTTKGFEDAYLSYCTKEWFKLSEDIRCIESAKRIQKSNS